MKPRSLLLSAIIALCLVDASASHAGAPSSSTVAPVSLTAEPLEIPAALRAQIDAVVASHGLISSITSWDVIPRGAAADVFVAPDVLFQIIELDVQLPWTAHGEINAGALANLLGSQAGLISQIAAVADPAGGAFRLGAYKWRHPTAPDFCSGETLYFMYFERTGALFALRFDSSSEC